MKKYVAKRLAISVLLIFIISVFSFMLIHILPGDPARLALGYEASEADVQAYRVELHLDKPLVTQYVLWIKGLFQGNFGRSILYNRPNLDILAERLPRTLGIGLPALLISIPLGILVGVICAVRRGKAVDQILLVGHHQHGGAQLVDPLQQHHDLQRALGVQIAGGLIGHNDLGIVHQLSLIHI